MPARKSSGLAQKRENSAEESKTIKPKNASVRSRKGSGDSSNSNDHGPILALPDGESKELDPLRLLLDPQNLRLLERTGGAFETLDAKVFGQKAIQDKLFELIDSDARFDIEALANSIANNGFLKHERIIVAPFDAEKFLVLEGNRRLTAVRHLIAKYGVEFEGLRQDVRDSLKTLPCFVLEGPTIDGSREQLHTYRRGAEIYIGMRHLMGAKSWEPASRYEFQSKLIFEEEWSINDVATRFGRQKRDVVRDVQAHLLYRSFTDFERRVGVTHSLTYNAFSEAARAPAILKWLEWDIKEQRFQNTKNQEVFFKYLISRLSNAASAEEIEEIDEVDKPEKSAEAAVRKLRDMLKLADPVVEEALKDGEFNSAEILFDERKEGALPKKISNFIKVLKRTPNDELLESSEVIDRLRELQTQIERSLKVIAALS